ncbi:hypothetical protein [Novipirellula aureliae]|uniref:hypothetical protein n=1 Tax=Novipirellula aureliae TaxID=2527966 RepID=UPI0018CF90AD|nr:hypothetical protein [Novipirellula aureliae]
MPLLLDSLDASEQEARQIEHHLDDRERCFADRTARLYAILDSSFGLFARCRRRGVS